MWEYSGNMFSEKQLCRTLHGTQESKNTRAETLLFLWFPFRGIKSFSENILPEYSASLSLSQISYLNMHISALPYYTLSPAARLLTCAHISALPYYILSPAARLLTCAHISALPYYILSPAARLLTCAHISALPYYILSPAARLLTYAHISALPYYTIVKTYS